MKRICSWLLALAGLLSLAGTTHAGNLPLIPLYLPGLFGQDFTGQAATPSGIPEVPARDGATVRDSDWLGEWLANSVDLLVEYAPEARVLVQSLRPCTPYHIAAAAILEYIAAMDAAQQPANPVFVGGPYYLREDQLTSPSQYAATPAVCAGSAAPACSKFGPCQACDAVPCPAVSASTKGCKCCEDCKDCKNNCTCAKGAPITTTHGLTGSIVVMQRCCEAPVCSAPVPMPAMPPHGPCTPFTFGFAPPPHLLVPPMPPGPLDELRELNIQRQMISAAIEQIEHELARIEMQRHVAMAPVVHNAQKVHLVTEHFEAHCDSLRCVNGNVHCVILEGDVRLSCKKCGQAVRIEAPRVVVNVKDGTFTVTAQQGAVAPPVAPLNVQMVPLTVPWLAPNANAVYSCPTPQLAPATWTMPLPAPHAYPTPHAYPVSRELLPMPAKVLTSPSDTGNR
jgi:hypothetical protein